MKRIVIKFLCCCLIFCSCNKENPKSQAGNSANYKFEDLQSNENLLDSIKLEGFFPYTYKFRYINKSTIKYINRQDPWSFDFEQIIDTLVYENNLLRSYISHNPAAPLPIKIEDENSLPTRFYFYEDNDPTPIQRQLGTYISYSLEKPVKINFKFLNSDFQRDSDVVNIKRNINGDIDSVFENNRFIYKFEYSTIQNKLKGNANLKTLNYLYIKAMFASFASILFDFSFINSDQSGPLENITFNALFCDVIFNSSYLPKDFYYTTRPYYLKYTFNENNYITSFSVGTVPDFNQITNERAVFTYYKKP